MLNEALIKKAEFEMTVCNACRYCEPICAVFKAIEQRRKFDKNSLVYLAHLCHDCRGCFYNCQYTPPHNFNLNIPKTFGFLRLYTYKRLLSFNKIKDLFDKYNFRANLLIFCSAFMFYFLIGLFFNKNDNIFAMFYRTSSFYDIIPENIMITSFIIPFLFVVLLYFYTSFKYARYIGIKNIFDIEIYKKVLRSIFVLEFLGGGGDGCNYPDEKYSFLRKWFHQCVMYGFLLTILSTIIACIKEHFFGTKPPYEIYDLPVLFGMIGGILLIIGLIGIIILRLKMDKVPYAKDMDSVDNNFIILLSLVVVSGFLVLIQRHSSLMGIMLILHLSMVFTFFVSILFNKFYHVSYRAISLYKYYSEINKDIK